MKVKLFAVVRAVRYPTSGAFTARVVDSFRDDRSAYDALEHLYDHEIPALARDKGWFLEAFDWETDMAFSYQIHRRHEEGEYYYWKYVTYSVQEIEVTA